MLTMDKFCPTLSIIYPTLIYHIDFTKTTEIFQPNLDFKINFSTYLYLITLKIIPHLQFYMTYIIKIRFIFNVLFLF